MRIIFVIATIVLSTFAYAQKPKLKLSTSSTQVQKGGRIEVNYEVNKKCNVKIPREFKGFRILSGPSTSSSVRHSNYYGKMQTTVRYVYSYIIQAEKEGKYKIPKATMVCEGENYESNEVTVEVTKGNSNAQNQAEESEYYFSRIQTNKNEVFAGEPFVLTYKVYSAYRIMNIDNLEFGNTNNIWSKDYKNLSESVLTQEVYNGKRYFMVELKKQVCIPNSAQNITVKPYVTDIVIGNVFNNLKKTVRSNELNIKVKPLPQGAPKDFSGAVGNFQMEAGISKNELKAGEGLDVSITVKGEGNIHLIDQYELKTPKSFDVFDPDIKEDFKYSSRGAKGKIEYNYLMTPGKMGEYEIGPINFSYFDLKSKSYKTITKDTFKINVLKGTGTYNAHTTLQNKVDTVQTLRYIKTKEPQSFTETNYWGKSSWFYSLLGFIPLSMAFGFVIQKRKNKEESRITKNRTNKANKFAVKKLKHAKNLLDNNDYSAFNAEMSRALYQYLTDKINLQQNQHDKQTIRQKFAELNISESTSNQYIAILEELEMAQYGQVEDQVNQNIYDNSINIIETVEKELKS